MQGIEFLTSTQVVTNYTFNTTAFWITALIVIGISVLIGIYEMEVLPCSLCGVIFGLLLGCLVGGALSEPTEYETQYKVTISDETSMTEFVEQYEIIDQDGKIFTVREHKGE